MRKIPTCVLTLSDLSQKETPVTKEISLSILNFISLFTTTDPRLSLVKNVHLIKKCKNICGSTTTT